MDAQQISWSSIVPLIQGAYFLFTGLWPLFHMRSFLAVTGPKTDLWLVKTVGVLIVAIALPLLLSAFRHIIPPEIVLLAVGSALGLAAIDCVYVWQGRIARIYLLDAAAEGLLVLLWIAVIVLA